MAEKVRILSIDGGGIRGVIPATVLAEIEKRSEKPVAELFDFVAGTSTGGILALGLTLDDGDGKPRYTADDLRKLYVDRGAEIFPPLRPKWLRAARGIMVERYPREPLEQVLKGYMKDGGGGEALLKNALVPVLIPAYEIELRTPFFFRSVRADDEPEVYDFPVWEVARATSAAPTYFEAARLKAGGDATDPFALVDGGVFANNPSMCAFADVRLRRHEQAEPQLESVEAEGVDPKDMVMVSLGTGELTKRIPWDEAKDYGFYGWGRQLLGVVMDGVSDTADFQCRQLLEDRYIRFQTKLEAGTDGLDDATQGNVEALSERAKELVGQSSDKIDQVCELLR
jgi:patatin-like phospholipase/acyl hydrolase